MGQAMHVVDLGREQQLADIGEDGIGRQRARGPRCAIDRGRDAAGVEALDDLDELDHGIADMAMAVGIEAVGLDHQSPRADQEIAEARPRPDAGMAVMGGIAGGEMAARLGLAGQEDPLMGNEDVVEQHDGHGLAVFGREFCGGLEGGWHYRARSRAREQFDN